MAECVWPQLFTVWQEGENAEGGHHMIKAMDRLPSNPEVENIMILRMVM